MTATPLTVADERPRAGLRSARDRQRTPSAVPALEPRPGSLAQRFAEAFPNRHPATVFLIAAVLGYVLLVALSVAFGLLLIDVVLRIDAVASADERIVSRLVGLRSASLTQASLIGSIVAGGVVIPTVVGLVVAALACLRRWRMAAFVLTAIVVEVSTYRLTTVFVHRDRPHVGRLESLPVAASYPSGHTAAAVAVYGGLALLLTSRFRNTWFRIACWSLALAIPPFVAMARMYRGMHHPLDAAAGGAMGVAALLVALFAARAAGYAARERAEGRR